MLTARDFSGGAEKGQLHRDGGGDGSEVTIGAWLNPPARSPFEGPDVRHATDSAAVEPHRQQRVNHEHRRTAHQKHVRKVEHGPMKVAEREQQEIAARPASGSPECLGIRAGQCDRRDFRAFRPESRPERSVSQRLRAAEKPKSQTGIPTTAAMLSPAKSQV